MSINKKYNRIKETLEALQTEKTVVDTLSSLVTVLTEATDADGNIKIVIDRNKQELTIPCSLLMDYVTAKKTERELVVNKLLDKVDIT